MPTDDVRIAAVKTEPESPATARPGQTARAAKRQGAAGDQQTTRRLKVKAEVKPEATEVKPVRRLKTSTSVKAEAPAPAETGAASTASAGGKRRKR